MALKGDIVPNVVNLPTMLSEELEYLRPYITSGRENGQHLLSAGENLYQPYRVNL